jgi:dihydroorotate dehydrogenase electron transfer subunit
VAPAPLRAEVEVVANRDEGAGNYRIVLQVPGWPGFAPGHFAMLSPGALAGVERSDPLLPRPMAVYRVRSSNGAAEVEILYKVSGRGTALLADTLPGQRLRFLGPLGVAWPEPEPGETALLVGGGTGIASIYELASRLSGRDARVLLGARSARDLMGRDDFASLDVAVDIATEDGSEGVTGRVTALLESALDSEAPLRVYACGPTPMMRACAELAAAKKCACFVSLESNMACGFGVCLGCAVPVNRGGYALVCRDGPVFDAASIGWEALP